MKLALIGAVLVAATSLAGPASAQAVVEDPGYCAQFYPNANCQNYGPGNPAWDGYPDRGNWSGSRARMMRPHSVRHHRHPTHKH